MKTVRGKLIQKTCGAHDEMLLRELFSEYDLNKSGVLCINELYAMLLQLEIPVHHKYL